MIASSPRRNPRLTRNAYPPEVFDLVTDILADLVLEDVEQFPQLPPHSYIDRTCGPENTAPITQVGHT
jgi:hypothetical protein